MGSLADFLDFGECSVGRDFFHAHANSLEKTRFVALEMDTLGFKGQETLSPRLNR